MGFLKKSNLEPSKIKAKAVIDSCESKDHFSAANNYINLYLKLHNDLAGYRRLADYLELSFFKKFNYFNPSINQ